MTKDPNSRIPNSIYAGTIINDQKKKKILTEKAINTSLATYKVNQIFKPR